VSSIYSLEDTMTAGLVCSTNSVPLSFIVLECNSIFATSITFDMGQSGFVLCPKDCDFDVKEVDGIELQGDGTFSELSSVCKAL